ncbi:hypothetical protein [Corynebacterium nuruki]|uniref:hypothetical protein n=1 Tax=Corynebacterium nuruki TaxID=1032851 RepID=UPI0002485E30|nr:hypothetical protein [Corynebacterium nuruki]
MTRTIDNQPAVQIGWTIATIWPDRIDQKNLPDRSVKTLRRHVRRRARRGGIVTVWDLLVRADGKVVIA